MKNETFLAELLKKESVVRTTGEKTGKDVSAALEEVRRQIRQCLEGNNILTGKGVTKSGVKD